MPRIAVIQSSGNRLCEWPGVMSRIDALVAEAIANRPDLIVLPECVWPAYFLGSKEAFLRAREAGMPSHDVFLGLLCRHAASTRTLICAGFVEQRGDDLFNSAALIDRDGVIVGLHRKCFLWDFDRRWFTAGGEVRPFSCSLGRVGIMICADARLPEIPATLVARGAELIVQPTAWVNAGTPAAPWNPQPEFLIPTRARECATPIASASKFGEEGDTLFVGSSLICDSSGRSLARAGTAAPTVIIADVALGRPGGPASFPVERAAVRACREPATPRMDAPPLDVELIAGEIRVRSGGESAMIHGPRAAFDLAGVRVAAVSSSEAASFAPIRLLALRGTHVVFVFGDDADEKQLRSRALENRVFVARVRGDLRANADSSGPRADALAVYDPRGRCIEATAAEERAWTWRVEASIAAEKCVAPKTDVLGGRAIEQYEF